MKAVSIKQPWAFLICSGIKDIENRTWKTNFRGRVLVHVSAKAAFKNSRELNNLFSEQQFGEVWHRCQADVFGSNLIKSAIIGSVEIVDCVQNHPSIWAESTLLTTDTQIYNWVLANPILFPEPIPAKGKLSFWDYPNILAEPEEENGQLFCHCQLPVKDQEQVMNVAGEFWCRYCGGIWYR